MNVDTLTEEPEVPPSCEHHYVSIHQPDFPPEIHWIRRCSLCHRIDGADLTESLRNAEYDRVREENEYDL